MSVQFRSSAALAPWEINHKGHKGAQRKILKALTSCFLVSACPAFFAGSWWSWGCDLAFTI